MTDNPMTMVERIARAIDTYGVEYSHVTLADLSTACRRWRIHRITDHAPTDEEIIETFDEKAPAYLRCRELNARAALDELREPTPRMIEAGMNAASVTLADEWRAMVDAERGEESL